MRDNITGKSILLCTDSFYGYGLLIKKELLKMGAKSVYMKPAAYFPGSFREKITQLTFLSWLKEPFARTHWTDNLIEEIKDCNFDTMLVVENMSFKKYFLDYMRSVNPQIRIILFLWDTFKTQQPRFRDYFSRFDVIYSFDKDDAKRYGFRYFPDFYIPQTVTPINDCKYDIAFVGAMNPMQTKYRGQTLRKIDAFCKENGLKTYFYIRYYQVVSSDNRLRRWYQIIKNFTYYKIISSLKNSGMLHIDSLPIADYNQIMADTRVILDLSYPGRQGMTINAITALANGKKLITTNKRIKEEPFYNPSMICIIDELSPELDMNFFRIPYESIDVSYLRIDNWLKHIVNENK